MSLIIILPFYNIVILFYCKMTLSFRHISPCFILPKFVPKYKHITILYYKIMGKKNYERPFMSVELFRPNEYCVGCDPTLVALKDESNGKDYTLVLDGGVPAEGSGVGAHMAEAEGANFTAFNCGGGHWMILGRIEDGHTNATINGEYDFEGGNGLKKCEDEIHRHLLDYHVSEYTSHHHFLEVIQKNPS